MPFLSLTRFR